MSEVHRTERPTQEDIPTNRELMRTIAAQRLELEQARESVRYDATMRLLIEHVSSHGLNATTDTDVDTAVAIADSVISRVFES